MEARLFDVVVLGAVGERVQRISEADIRAGWVLAVDFGSRSGCFSAGSGPGSVVFCSDAPVMCARLSSGAFGAQALIPGGAEAEIDREGTALYSDRDGDALVVFCAHARTGAVVDSLEGAPQLSEAQRRVFRGAVARLGLSDRECANSADSSNSAKETRTARPKRQNFGRKRDQFALGPEEVASALEVRMLSAHEYLLSKVMIPALDQVEKHIISAAFGCDIEVTVSGDHVLLSASQPLDVLQLEQQGADVQPLPACEQLAVDLRGTLFFFPTHNIDVDVLDFCLLVARKSEIRAAVERHFAEAAETQIPPQLAIFCARQRNFILSSVLGVQGSVSAEITEPARISPRKRLVRFVQPIVREEEEISLSGSPEEKERDDAGSESCKSAVPVPPSQLPPYGLQRIQIHSGT